MEMVRTDRTVGEARLAVMMLMLTETEYATGGSTKEEQVTESHKRVGATMESIEKVTAGGKAGKGYKEPHASVVACHQVRWPYLTYLPVHHRNHTHTHAHTCTGDADHGS